MAAAQVAIITGATSGIGLSTARLFAEKGLRVVITGRNRENLSQLSASIRSDFGEDSCFSVPADVCVPEDVRNVITSTMERYDRLDVLVNSAGVLKAARTQETTEDIFNFNMDVNCKGVFAFMNTAIPHLKKSDAASIVNVSSVNGMQSFPGSFAYCASKAAVDMMTRCAAVDLAEDGIRVNSVNPGVVVTNLQKRGGLDDASYESFLERSRTVTHPIGRVGTPSEIAEAIFFLAAPETGGFITGANIPIDGGRVCLGAR